MIITINKKYGYPLIIDTDKMTSFEESGQGYDISFGKDTYYFSLKDTQYIINQIFKRGAE